MNNEITLNEGESLGPQSYSQLNDGTENFGQYQTVVKDKKVTRKVILGTYREATSEDAVTHGSFYDPNDFIPRTLVKLT